MAKQTKTQSFEDAFERLEAIVKELEDGQLALEENIKLFEEGVQLSASCRKQLDAAEQKIQKLVKSSEDTFNLENLD